MHPKVFLPVLLATCLAMLAFRPADEIDRCFLSEKRITELEPRKPDRLPEESRVARSLETEAGEVLVSRVDGYRILYINRYNAPFVNVKVELSADGEYDQDTTKLLRHFNHLAGRSKLMESKTLMHLNFNGYPIYGYSRSDIDSGKYLGTFVMFPGRGITVHFYFQNLRPEYRNFKNLEDYKSQRNAFLGEYTRWLRKCQD